MASNEKVTLRVDAGDFVLFDSNVVIGDTFIFEPSPTERKLGSMFVVAEIENRSEIGLDLVETVVQALQREYYRDLSRSALTSFESSLHQANLVLHDLVEQGVRDWMGTFHVAVGVLAGSALHVSTAGESQVLLSRSKQITSIAEGLSHSPITDPLRTFSQVASGELLPRDVLYFVTSEFPRVFSDSDLTRFVAEQNAATISLRLRQLYEDRRADSSMAVLVLSLLSDERPQKKASSEDGDSVAQREPISMAGSLKPRKPIIINRSVMKRLSIMIGSGFLSFWKKLTGVVWPFVRDKSLRGGSAIVTASKRAGQGAARGVGVMRPSGSREGSAVDPHDHGRQSPLRPRVSLETFRSSPKRLLDRFLGLFRDLPLTSKVFGVIALVLAIALIGSLVFLQQKRTEDARIQQASESLHDARNKKNAAETALIYDNRDQARMLLEDASGLVDELAVTGLYTEETEELRQEIVVVRDRLAKVTRVSDTTSVAIGDFSGVLTRSAPQDLFYVDGALYSFDRTTNMVAKMSLEGETSVVSENTQGIGFFVGGTAHETDKTIVLLTDEPGVALLDTTTGLVQKQEIDFPSADAEVLSIAAFGNRLYVYDKTARNIYGYSKTLRGYSGGAAWISDSDFPGDTVRSIGVDGFIFTLHEDGSIRKLFKGNEDDLTVEVVDPPLPSTATLLVNEELRNLYVFDAATKRVVVYDTVGNLVRQIFFNDAADPKAMAVDPDERTVYLLDGTKVVGFSLREG